MWSWSSVPAGCLEPPCLMELTWYTDTELVQSRGPAGACRCQSTADALATKVSRWRRSRFFPSLRVISDELSGHRGMGADSRTAGGQDSAHWEEAAPVHSMNEITP